MRKKQLEIFTIKPHESIRKAMETISNNYHGIALVVDDDFRLMGVITDGDIRRGLLRGLTFESDVHQIMSQTFISVTPDLGRAEVLDIMMARKVRQVPVLDTNKELLGIHFMEELLGTAVKPNIAVIMAGGKGIRLRPLTEHCPKPMIKVAGRPILERIVLHLVGFGIYKIYISVNYLSHMIEDYFGDGSTFGCSIRYVREAKPLGTGGALSLLPEIPDFPFIVLNGDLVTQVDIASLLQFHDKQNVEATIGVRPHVEEIPFGVINESNNRLSKIEEKPSMFHLVNAGVYVFNPSVLKIIPENEDFPITQLFDLLLEKESEVGVYLIEEEWIDVGRHEELDRARGIAKS